jgi:SET domain-containing protein
MKDKLFLSPKIQVRTKEARRGVFCTADIKKGECVEESGLILLENNKWEECDKELLNYAFPWAQLRSDWKDFCDEHGGILPFHATRPVLVLGYGMLYGRSPSPNISFKIEKKLFTCNFIATCDIKEGEEILLPKAKPEKDNGR